MLGGINEVEIKGGWSLEEDELLLRTVQFHGAGPHADWTLISRSIPGRTPKSCRLRWCNQLSPEVNHQPFTPEEDEILFRNQAIMGNKWTAIARLLKGRTDNSVKNRFYGLKRKWSARNYEPAVPYQAQQQQQEQEQEQEQEQAEDTERTESNLVAVPLAICYHPPPPEPEPVVTISDSESKTHPLQATSQPAEDPNMVLLINRIVKQAVDKSVATLRDHMDKAISEVKEQLSDHIAHIVTREMGNTISGIVRNEMETNIVDIVKNEISKLKKN